MIFRPVVPGRALRGACGPQEADSPSTADPRAALPEKSVKRKVRAPGAMAAAEVGDLLPGSSIRARLMTRG